MEGHYELETFLVKCWPIGDAAVHKTDMDVVEVVFWIHPLAAAIVNLEAKVRRSVIFLDAGEIGPCEDEQEIEERVWNMSIPIISASGNWSAKFLTDESTNLDSGEQGTVLCPNAISATNVQHVLRFLKRSQKQFVVERQEPDVVASRAT